MGQRGVAGGGEGQGNRAGALPQPPAAVSRSGSVVAGGRGVTLGARTAGCLAAATYRHAPGASGGTGETRRELQACPVEWASGGYRPRRYATAGARDEWLVAKWAYKPSCNSRGASARGEAHAAPMPTLVKRQPCRCPARNIWRTHSRNCELTNANGISCMCTSTPHSPATSEA